MLYNKVKIKRTMLLVKLQKGGKTMLNGEYFHQCDQKFRLRMPVKIKKEFSDGCFVTKGNDGCLFIFSTKQFESLTAKLDSLPLFDSKAQRPLRMLLSSAFEVEEDAQGRFLLPAALREFAGIKKDVVFIGVGNRAELWDKERWTKYNESMGNFDECLSELGEYGI